MSRHYCHAGFEGCVQRSRTRQSGTIVGVYHGAQAGLDDTGDPNVKWFTVSEDHNRLVGHPTLELARSHASDPQGWCGVCNGSEPADDPDWDADYPGAPAPEAS